MIPLERGEEKNTHMQTHTQTDVLQDKLKKKKEKYRVMSDCQSLKKRKPKTRVHFEEQRDSDSEIVYTMNCSRTSAVFTGGGRVLEQESQHYTEKCKKKKKERFPFQEKKKKRRVGENYTALIVTEIHRSNKRKKRGKKMQ